MDVSDSHAPAGSSPERIVELATLARRARQFAGECVRRGLIDRAIVDVTDRDRLARLDRRLMPDRLRLPPEIVQLLLEAAR